MWGCGLKSCWYGCLWITTIVILHVRMWIEIILFTIVSLAISSSSMWGCGLKLLCLPAVSCPDPVILHVRMWIEISLNCCCVKLGSSSSSMWGCGLKSLQPTGQSRYAHVILHVRMWIEIVKRKMFVIIRKVILHVRMWIEIFLHWRGITRRYSHPPCEDVDWNIYATRQLSCVCASSSMWGCGLKLYIHSYRLHLYPSSSMWGCGLKLILSFDVTTFRNVILHVRMWIEILYTSGAFYGATSHPPCEDVDWNSWWTSRPAWKIASSSMWGCGLKFWWAKEGITDNWSSSMWGCGLKYDELLP